jgi:hypothetical protein
MKAHASHGGWGIANPPKEKIDRLKSIVPSVRKTEGLSFWAGKIAMKKHFIHFGSFIIKYYSNVRFSEETTHSGDNI